MWRVDKETAEELLVDFFDGYESLPLQKALALLRQLAVPTTRVAFLNGPVWVAEYNATRYVIDGDEADLYAYTATVWLDDAIMQADDFVEIDDLQDFWLTPHPLYHATVEENVGSILENGIEVGCVTRGMANRAAGAAVFTSMSLDNIDSYGDYVFEIDTAAMKRDGYMPRVTGEPGLADYAAMSAVVRAVGMEEDYIIDVPDESEDYETVIIYSNVPVKYVTLLGAPEKNPGDLERLGYRCRSR